MINSQDTNDEIRKPPEAGERSEPLLGKDYNLDFPMRENASRIRRYKLQDIARKIKRSGKVSTCYRRIAFDPATRKQYQDIAIKINKHGNMYTSRLWACNDRWSCPVCQWAACSKYLERMLLLLVDKKNVSKYVYGLQTITIGHKAWQSPEETISIFKKTVNRHYSGKWYSAWRRKWHIIGGFHAIDILYTDNGTHIHQHALLVLDRGGFWVPTSNGDLGVADHLSDKIIVEMLSEAAPRIAEIAIKCGGYADPAHCYNLEKATSADKVAEYIAKLAMEVSLAPAKRGDKSGMTLLELLEAAENETKYGKVWSEITDQMKGTPLVSASKGLWKTLGGKEPDKAELSDGGENDALLALLSKEDWHKVLREGRRQDWFEHVAAGMSELDNWCNDNDLKLIAKE